MTLIYRLTGGLWHSLTGGSSTPSSPPVSAGYGLSPYGTSPYGS
jgi:hypothetical protein